MCLSKHFIRTQDILRLEPLKYHGARVSSLNQLADKQNGFHKLGAWLLYLTTAVGSLFLAGLMPGGWAVWSLTPRSPTVYRACG